MKVIDLCIGHSRRNATGIVQTLHHTLRVSEIKIARGIDRISAVDLNSVRAVLLSLHCSLIRSIDQSERCV